MSFKSSSLRAIAALSAIITLSCGGFTPQDNYVPEPNAGPGDEQPQEQEPTYTDDGLVQISFEESDSNIANPERGLYYPCNLKYSSSTLSVSEVKSQRLQGRTLFYIQYRLDKCMSSDIPDDYLSKMQKNFDVLREGGAKCILRFCYKENEAESNKPWDAEEQWVMRHIEQVKPMLRKNEDVIMLFQAGYVGVWGEWYYTDHFVFQPSSQADYQPRRRVLEAMLEALPESRQVAVRTPDFKMHMYGLSLSDTLTAATAHNGSVISRIGGYNDCFGASEDDYGTFCETNSRPFWKADTRYTFMGGETCAVSDYCKCQASISDMENYHWTYLNIEYNKNVLSGWKTGGCYDEVTKRLGYRFVLDKINHTPAPAAGEPYKIVLYLKNIGFSAPHNPRDAKLAFLAKDGTKTIFDLGSDPRTWHPGLHRIEVSVELPSLEGSFYLLLSDPLLPDRPEYSIALANKGVWDSSTGFNKLFDI